MSHDWLFVVIYSLIILPLWRWFSIWDYKRILKRRETRFLKAVWVTLPDATKVEFFSISTSDKKALEEVQRQLGLYKEQVDTEEEWPWHSSSRSSSP